MRQYTVRYQIATYEGEVQVSADENEEDETIIDPARKKLQTRVGSLPFGSESWKILSY